MAVLTSVDMILLDVLFEDHLVIKKFYLFYAVHCRYTVLEKSSSLGGTWHDNTYPGCACDVPSHLYSYSFYPNPAWSRNYSRQREILEYLQRAAARWTTDQICKRC